MLKVLLKKQLLELSQGFFVDRRSGQRRPKAKVARSIVVFALLMLLIMGSIFGMVFGVADLFVESGYPWAFFTVMSLFALMAGTFSSLMLSYSGLFRAGDNELLLSLPIPVSTILNARLASMLAMCFAFQALVWIPALAWWACFGAACTNLGPAVIPTCLLLWLCLTLMGVAIACVIGWVIAQVSGRVKNRGPVALACIIVLMAIYTWVQVVFQSALSVGGDVGAQMAKGLLNGAPVLCQLGFAACGDVVALLSVVVAALVVFGLVWLVLSKTFANVLRRKASARSKATYSSKKLKAASPKCALLGREWKRFVGSVPYLTNCGISVVIMLVAAVLAVVEAPAVSDAVSLIVDEAPVAEALLPIAVFAAVVMMACLCATAGASVSMEGKTLWLVRSLPVGIADVLTAKMQLQLLVSGIPSVICCLAIGYAMGLNPAVTVAMTLAVLCFVCQSAAAALAFNLKWPNLTWTNEAVPVKQGLPIVLTMFGGWAVDIVLAGVFVALRLVLQVPLDPVAYFAILCVVLVAAAVLVVRWNLSEGARRFEAL